MADTAASRERAAPTAAPPPPVRLRPLNRDVLRELNFVRSAWSRAALLGRPAKIWEDPAHARPTRIERMDESVYFESHVRRLVPKLLARSTVIVAEPLNTPKLLAGFIAFEPARRVIESGFARPEADRPTVVHFLYVISELRRDGVGGLLAGAVPAGSVTYSHWLPAMERLASRRGWTYDPTRTWD